MLVNWLVKMGLAGMQTLFCVTYRLTTYKTLKVISDRFCSESDNSSPADTSALVQWQAGKTVTVDAVQAYGGIDKCFAAEPIPDDVWARMQGKTYKENPHIGRDDLRHVRALHWDYDNQLHVGEMVVNKSIAERVVTILRKFSPHTAYHWQALHRPFVGLPL